jgi:hypothetical protein
MKLDKADFDLLTECSMMFKSQDWESQIERFDETPNFNHKFIYWFENSVGVMLATKYLQQEGHEYQVNYDLKFDQPILTTNFEGVWKEA